MPTSISVTRTPAADTGHDAPVSVDTPPLEPFPVTRPPSPHITRGVTPASAEPLLDPPLDEAPELPPELAPELPPEPLPDPLPPELPVPELPLPEPLLVAASESPRSGDGELVPHAVASSTKHAQPAAHSRLPPLR
jgi:hypothetical protein